MEKKTAFLRAYIQSKEKDKKEIKTVLPDGLFKISYNELLVVDTETTTDIYQNLLFGGFLLVNEKKGIKQYGLFHEDSLEALDPHGFNELKRYSEKYNIPLISRRVFLEKHFFPKCFFEQIPYVGMNNGFDLSRLATSCPNLEDRKPKESLRLRYEFEKENFEISVKRFGLAEKFSFSKREKLEVKTSKSGEVKYNWKSKNVRYNRGIFLDIGHLYSVFYASGTEKFSLEEITKNLDLPTVKEKAKEHGVINEEYIEYNLNDVESTYLAFREIEKYKNVIGLKELPLEECYSGASIGKHIYKELGILPFREINPDVEDEEFGLQMGALYAGRVEAAYRHIPVKCEVLDFTSMYPSVVVLTGLWDYMISSGYEKVEATEDIKKFIDEVTMEDLQKPETWKNLIGIVKICPNGDFLPTRTGYDESSGEKTVAIQKVFSDLVFPYHLMDAIASKMITGKSPEIVEGYYYYPKEPQETLRPTNVLGFEIDPLKENLYKFLVEKRAELKTTAKSLEENDPEKENLLAKAQALKIISNGTSYGIYIEENTEKKESWFSVNTGGYEYGSHGRTENEGKHFNPLIGVSITAGSRLLLTLAQAKAIQLGYPHYYTDTDSLFVNPEIVKPLMAYFNEFNPYTNIHELLKLEDDKLKNRYGEKVKRIEGEDGLLYPTQYTLIISSKRYVVYAKDKNGEPDIDAMEGKLHGLGHISRFLNGLESKEDNRKVKNWTNWIWRDIILYLTGKVDDEYIEMKYNHYYEISKMSIRTPHVYHNFRFINRGKPWREQIKPFNFFLKGNSIDKSVIPIGPYQENPQEMVRKPFINEKTGIATEGEEYFKTMDNTFILYCNHPEKKFIGERGYLERREIFFEKVVGIGKEINTEEMFNNDLLEKERNENVYEEQTIDYLKKLLERERGNLREKEIREIEAKLTLMENADVFPEKEMKGLIQKIRRTGKDVKRKPVFLTKEQNEYLQALTSVDAARMGISQQTLYELKKKGRCGKAFNENVKTTGILINELNKAFLGGTIA